MRRITELDGLRGLAAAAVVLFHFTTRYDQLYNHSEPYPAVFRLGYLGVHVFFVISGFVIFLTLEKKKSCLDFAISRFSRLFPVYWVAMLLTFVITTGSSPQNREIEWSTVLGNFTMLQNFLSTPYIDGSYWSLTWELCFYIWAAFLFYARPINQLYILIVGVLICALAIDLGSKFAGYFIPYNLRIALILDHFHLFLMGVLLHKYSKTPANYLPLLFTLPCLLISYLVSNEAFATTFITLIAFITIIHGKAAFLGNRIFKFIGGISYSLYLIHQEIGYKIIYINPLKNQYLSIFLAILVSIGLALCLTYIIERPAQRVILSIWQRRKPFSKVSDN